MKTTVHKQIFQTLLYLVTITVSLTTTAQNGNGAVIPELVFQNPVLISGTPGAEGAKYRFPNVATGLDAILEIKKKSDTSVKINNIDLTAWGWNKAFQPEMGIAGTTPANQNWYIRYKLEFVQAGTTQKRKIQKFYVTALDVDGDGVSISEWNQFINPDSIKRSSVTYLQELAPINLPGVSAKTKKIKGPTDNFTNIDTASTAVMVTYTYMDVDGIDFILGGESGASTSTAGMRLNSIWFKSFSLAPAAVLPVKMADFNAVYKGADVTLNWTTEMEENFSHFVVQRSTDGKNYTDIATVFSAGGNGVKTQYAYKDRNVSSTSGMNFYRILCVDKTEEATFSAVRIVRLSKDNASTIALATYPNPVKDQLRVTLPASFQGKKVTLALYNANGIQIQAIQLGAASQTEVLQLGNQSKGFYLVKATCEDQVAQQRVIKN